MFNAYWAYYISLNEQWGYIGNDEFGACLCMHAWCQRHMWLRGATCID